MGIGRGELPVDGRAHRIAALFPGRHLRDQDGFGRDTPVKTLAGQHRDLDFNHVQPTAMFGSVMELQLASNAAGLGWLKDFIQDLRSVTLTCRQQARGWKNRNKLQVPSRLYS